MISSFIDSITKFLALSESVIIELKRTTDLENLDEKEKIIINTLKTKFIFFYIINFIFILLFWYYIGCFCAVYKNTQNHLIKDTLISFSISYIIPFGANIITALIRIHSLKIYTGGNQIIFNLSKLLQSIL